MMKVEIKEIDSKTEKKIIAVQVPYEIYEKLKQEAEDDYISVSDVTRRIIIRHFRNNTTK